ncbi:MAG: hypothetical protein QXT31_04730, partial [Candidatus Bathyarchaeia archaeon]
MKSSMKKFFLSVIVIELLFSIVFFIFLAFNSYLLGLFTDYAVAICAFLPVISGFLLIKKYTFNSIYGKC